MQVTETESILVDVEMRQAALDEARQAVEAAAHAFEDVLAEAHDAGYSYRHLAGVTGFGHHYVGDLIKASRARGDA